MGTRSILEIARDVAGEVGLQRPLSLFGYAEGDETAAQLLRAATWTCRYLSRHFTFKEYTTGSIGKAAGGEALAMVFVADTDTAWPPDEILHLGMLWRIEHGDRVESQIDMKDFDAAVTEWIWTQRSSKPYTTLDAGMVRPSRGGSGQSDIKPEIDWV